MTDLECSRCGFIAKSGDDQQIRMDRHTAGRHTPHKTKSQRDGSIIKGFTNLDIGKVSWYVLWT